MDEVDVEYDPDELEGRVDTLHELGVEPEAFVTHLLSEQGGSLKQQAFTDYTDSSEPTVTRLLQEMEDEGLVQRVSIGREKVVFLPGHAPTDDRSTADDEGPGRVA